MVSAVFKENASLFPLASMPPTQAESVIKSIIREIGQECAAHGEVVSETLVAFMVSRNIFVTYYFAKRNIFNMIPICTTKFCGAFQMFPGNETQTLGCGRCGDPDPKLTG